MTRYGGLIDPQAKEPKLSDLWDHEGACKVSKSIRICPSPDGGWVVLQKLNNLLLMKDPPFSTFKMALQSTMGRTLKEDRYISGGDHHGSTPR